MNPTHRRRRRLQEHSPWPLVWSLTIHLWFAGLAMGLVWKLWEGQDDIAEPSLLEPGDGGERATFLSLKPKQESRVVAVVNQVKSLHSELPSEVSVRSKPAPVAEFSPLSLPYLPGAGWNGGVGKSLARGNGGEGIGLGSGCGHGAYYRSCGSLRLRPTPRTTHSGFDHLILVLDISGSVRAGVNAEDNPAPLREFINCASTLPPEAFFNVVCFAGEAEKFREDSVRATADNIAAAVVWAREKFRRPRSNAALPVPAGTSGTSRLDLGLSAALQECPREVLLISDGQPLVREGNRSLPHAVILAGVRAAVPDYKASPVIHTIAMRESGSGFLRRLAAEFGGDYRSAVSE
jgi:hypothetical protein